MSWLTRLLQHADDPAPVDTSESVIPITATSFSGVTDDPTRGVASGQTGLYEFWTDSGKHVWLHDMDFRGVSYTAAPPPELRMTFDWYESPVPEPYAGPVVEFIFGDVRLYEWVEDDDDENRRFLHEVRVFDYTDGYFTLNTAALSLSFTARTCHVAVLD